MSMHDIMNAMKELSRHHHALLELSKEKTEIIKKGEMAKLQTLLAKEQRLIRLMEQTEEKRMAAAEKWFRAHDLSTEDMTITAMLKQVEDERKEELEHAAVKLAEIVVKLKQQEKLNHDLIQQSLSYVQLSLNMLQPTIQNMNYGKEETAPAVKRSVFDSKA